MNKIKQTKGERIFNVFNVIFMFLLMVVMLYPFLHVIFASLSSPAKLNSHRGFLWHPLGLTFDAYKLMSRNPMILRGYLNTIFIVVVGVIINIFMTSLGAYVLSRKNLYFQKILTLLIIFTMYFSGGMIPFYFTVRSLKLENTLWALIIPNAINTFNLLIMRTSFAELPDSLTESAHIDGAGHFTILLRIIMPLSKAVLAVMVLYYAVGHWNSWFNAMLFLSDRKLFPLQLILREILVQNDTSSMMQNINIGEQSLVGETIKYAVIVVSTLPIICVYPFVQKYFVKGVMIGAVKG